ncbi:transcriptional regulator protein [Micromonospora sp. NPDC049559]|uniref:ParB/RepB/Spo0J family partition protein n=1 Tax=Micromonospora sp. NPDC049559 TaxID=3155923 RepID=UPI003439469B
MPKRLSSEPTDQMHNSIMALPQRQPELPTSVPIHLIKVAASPRINGENSKHTELLLESGVELPPILVHRQTMCIVDGVHRLRAAQKRGDTEIAVDFFDGDEEDAFLEAVRANLAHGLPLSLADRRAAAVRVLDQHPEWSDRAVAEAVGLSPDFIGAVRRLSTTAHPSMSRIGRDGRVRPVDSSQGRIKASQVIASKPNASLREVARNAGIAVGTARDVRDRIQRGLDPVPARQRAAQVNRKAATRRLPEPASSKDPLSTLQGLKKDPSLRFSEAGRRLLRWVDLHAVSADDRTWVATAVPPHCANLIIELAIGYAAAWQGIADAIERQVQPKAI